MLLTIRHSLARGVCTTVRKYGPHALHDQDVGVSFRAALLAHAKDGNGSGA